MSAVQNLLRAGLVATVAMCLAAPLAVGPAQASEIRYIVNKEAVTSYDIQRRAAFLRIQNRRGNLQKLAADEMIEQALRIGEMKRLNIRIGDDQVAQAYERFARSNNMSPSQMDQVLNQSGVTKGHFREFIRTQMGWSQVLGQRSRGNRLSEQDVAHRMLQQGGTKPTATEYMLQQVIFVVPASERGKIATRKREAEAMRQRFRDCGSTKEFARGLLDVTVRDLGRVLDPELPPDWAGHVRKTSPGSATAVRQTERGVEFLGVCSTREVSDDRVAQMVFQAEDGGGGQNEEELSRKLTEELKSKATIIRR